MSQRTRAHRALHLAMLTAAAVALAAALLGTGVRSTYGGQAAVDEPQYLLTALSLWEDGNLDIADELAARRWTTFHDAELPVQTEVQLDGSQISPHDPLLPMLLAVPMGLGGWVAAKFAMALLAGCCAALCVWVAVRRLMVPPALAGAGVSFAFASPPLAVYGNQVYPELPAATLVLLAVAVLAAPAGRFGPRGLALAGATIVALPWLSVKYLPVALTLTGLALWQLARARRFSAAAWFTGCLGVAGAVYLAVHRVVWGGWTVYASGDHFSTTGEFSVIGVSPDYAGRSLRLVGLLVDRAYGLVPWQVGWLLVVPAAAAIVSRRPWRMPAAATVLLPAAAGWATATWVALTMHGVWWPGRQVVVILPLLLLGVLWWSAHVAGSRLRWVAAALASTGVLALGALLVDGWSREITWVSGFADVDNPIYLLLEPLLPDYRSSGAGLWWRHIAWVCLLAALAAAGWRHARRTSGRNHVPPAARPEEPADAPTLASTRA